MKLYIHYGNNTFNTNIFSPISNSSFTWNKPYPYTGFWASPLFSKASLFTFCGENGMKDKLDGSFIFTITEKSNILKIKNSVDLDEFKKSNYIIPLSESSSILYPNVIGIDFEKMICDGYDGIEVFWRKHAIKSAFWGWDCDTLLIFNPEIIVELEK